MFRQHSSSTMTDTVFQVAIVGGGIAGLAAASVLRKKHKVTIFERNAKDVPESGAAVGLGPNGSKMALALGLSQEGLRGVVSQGIKTYDQHENKLNETGLDYAKIFGSEWWFVHRQDLKDCLLEIVQDGFKGNNVDIRYEANVTGVDSQAGLVFFADGTSFHADLIIGTVCLIITF
jgi:salicylate hydroxylase